MKLEKLGKLNHPMEKLFHDYFHFHPFIKLFHVQLSSIHRLFNYFILNSLGSFLHNACKLMCFIQGKRGENKETSNKRRKQNKTWFIA